ncbi:MAG TPA: DUF4160 domain-containing protein [Solirubrobacterales bacterium]|jgi:hypothetical protein|nr:DUF4160 domain-containing protein [Solirubrobacterales bacterium]
MPRISTFYGIAKLAMYFRDHNPPHLHAAYAEYAAKVEIATGEVFEGELPRRARRFVAEWAELDRAELQANWKLARSRQALANIDPLP